jgi:hypothetical protein
MRWIRILGDIGFLSWDLDPKIEYTLLLFILLYLNASCDVIADE